MSENKADTAFYNLEGLIKKTPEDLTESDTRAKYIDPLFTDVLGYVEEDIRRETHVHEGYIDYVFSVDGIRRFVLEAKRIGESFRVPESLMSRYYRIDGSISSDKRIKEAIEQAQQYCIDSGVRYGVITNGNQYIVFEAFKSGKTWRTGHCVVFRSLADIKENFSLFWNTLSKDSVKSGSLRRYVSQEALPMEFVVPRQELHAANTRIARNDLSPFVQPFVDHAFSTMTDESQLNVLERCYVREKQYEDASIQIGHHFDRPPDFAKKYGVETVIETPAGAGRFEEIYQKCEEFLRTRAPTGSLILLMGGIGAGKTTFIHHFFKFVIKDKSRTVWFYVDFLKATPEPSDIERYVYQSIVNQFEERYRGTLAELREELARVGLTAIRPEEKDMKILFSLLTLSNYTTSIVLDNVDQYSYVSPRYQEETLLIARNLTEALRTITIVTLREESYFKSVMSGVLDSFRVPTFHVGAPYFETLVRRRVEYVLNLLMKNDEEIQKVMRTNVVLGDRRNVLLQFFEIIKDSLRYERRVGKEILRFINAVSGANMRLALDFFSTFLVSGNTDVGDMLSTDEWSRKKSGIGYQIPLHHFVRSIALSHSRLYSEAASMVMNLYAVNPEWTNSHFIHLRLLNYLHIRRAYYNQYGRGYVEIDSIIQEAERLLINRNAIADSLKKMARFGLVEFENQSKEGYQSATYVRVTATGTYYLMELAHTFAYLDLVWMDTPICNKDLVKKLLTEVVELRGYKVGSDIFSKYDRTKRFVRYLGEMETREFANNPEFRDSDLTKEFMPDITRLCKEEMQYIESKRQRSDSSLSAVGSAGDQLKSNAEPKDRLS